MKNKISEFKIAKNLLIFWCLFIGVGALYGGIAMLLEPDGSLLQMQEVLKYFEKLPFSDILFNDYTFSGIALICVNGITNITAAVLLFMRRKAGIVCGTVFGVTLMLWICIQFYMFPADIIGLSLTFFIFGLLQFATGYAAWIFYRRELFSFDVSDYKNIGTNKKELVVFFSRTGYTRKVAYEEANRVGADIYEITSPVRISGFTGFWRCGHYALMSRDMPIDEVAVDLSGYDKVTVCSPVWVFKLCSPVQTFCRLARGRINSVSYILLHTTNARYDNACRRMDELLGILHEGVRSIGCKAGKMREVYNSEKK